MKKRAYASFIFMTVAASRSYADQNIRPGDVPPKEEWRVCAVDSDCESIVFNCSNAGPYSAFNKKFNDEYSQYYNQICLEKIHQGVVTLIATRADQPPDARCIKQKCEVAPEKPIPEEKPSYLKKFKSWLNDLF